MFLLSDSYWEVRKVAHKGRGVYVKSEISPGSVIGDYSGKIVNASDVEDTLDEFYDLHITEELVLIADPDTIGVHLLNHSCAANCAMFPYKGHTLFFALRRIFTGEELTIFYYLGAPAPEEEMCLDICHCGSPICRGTMHNPQVYNDRFEAFEKQSSSKYFRQFESLVGQQLPVLSGYPKTIEDYPLYDIFGSLDQEPLIREGTRIPELSQLRHLIRESGRQISFVHFGICVYGIMNNLIVSAFV